MKMGERFYDREIGGGTPEFAKGFSPFRILKGSGKEPGVF